MIAQPFVTVIMPIRNEGGFISRSLGAVIGQTYPSEYMEILVVDGMSDDGTRAAVQQIIEEQQRANTPRPRINLLDNPQKIVPPALNIGLRQAGGDIIVRVDGHCEIAPDYLSRCVETLQQVDADCVGGVLETIGQNESARVIALAQSSPFGVGGAAFRTGREQASYVDTLAFGAYRREVFERIGGFDEELVRNQDDEFNFRLIQAGGKIWLDPAIKSIYYSRASLGKLWRQYFQYGFYKVRVMQKRGGVASWRHLVPAAFVLSLVGSLLLALLTRRPAWGLSVAGPYAAANAAASLHTARQDWQALPHLPLIFLTLHMSYGVGFLLGLWHWAAVPVTPPPRLDMAGVATRAPDE